MLRKSTKHNPPLVPRLGVVPLQTRSRGFVTGASKKIPKENPEALTSGFIE